VLKEGAGDRKFSCICLAVEAAAFRENANVELVLQVSDLKGLEKLSLKGESGENVLERLVVDGDLTSSGGEPCAGARATAVLRRPVAV